MQEETIVFMSNINILSIPILCALIAKKKRYSGIKWFFIGLLFNVFALIYIIFKPSIKIADDFYNLLEKKLKKAIAKRKKKVKFSFKVSYYKIKKNTLSKKIKKYINSLDDYYYETFRNWSYSYSGNNKKTKIKITLKHHLGRRQDKYLFKEIKAIIKEIITPKTSIHHQLKAIHDYIAKEITYDNNKEKRTAYDALKYGETVCAGYAQLTYLMLKEVGIESIIISGETTNESDSSHAWNMVNLNGQWYHLDTTWNSGDGQGVCKYKYYNLSDEEISSTHFWQRDKYPSASYKYVNHLLLEKRSNPKIASDYQHLINILGLAQQVDEYAEIGL